MAKRKQPTALTTAKEKALQKSGMAKQGGPRKRKSGVSALPSAEQRHRMISEAAYYIAEHRGFAAGDTIHDWLQAEKQIDSQLSSAR